MEKKNSQHHGHAGSAFIWGLAIGAIFATLLSTKRGRGILREVVNMGMELIENVAEERKEKNFEKAAAARGQVVRKMEQEEVKNTAEDLATGIEAVEDDAQPGMDVAEVAASTEFEVDEVSEEALDMAKKAKAAEKSPKKRLFRGIRKGKAN